MTFAEKAMDSVMESIPISAEDGRNGVFVLVSAVSVLSGVVPTV